MKKNFMFVCLALLCAMALIVSCDNSTKNPDAGKFTVTFDTDGGGAIDSVKVGLWQTVPEPEKPTREGYLFVEWQLDGTKYDFKTPVTKNITLKAIWKFDGVKVSDAESLKAAIDAGKNALLSADIELSESLVINNGKNIVIDLNNYNISCPDRPFIIFNANVSFVGKGVIYESENDKYAAIQVKGSSTDRENYTVVTIGPDVVLRGWSGIFISKDEDGGDNNYGIVINFKGTAINPGMDAHSAAGYGLYINGSNNKTTGNVPIININGGKIQSLGAGIYAAGFAKWNIFGNTKITGKQSAIEIRAGKLNITDGIFTATNTPTSITANGSGTTSDGVAIAVAQHTTKLPIDVNIKGGSFNGYSALYESNPQNNDSESIAKVKLEVSSGTFNATNGGTVAVHSQDCTRFITGGTFSSDPSAFVNTNYKAKANENDTWTVIKK